MGFLDRLLRAERKIQGRIDLAFGKGAAQTPLEIRREMLEEVESHIVSRKGKRTFPFTRVAVRLYAPQEDMRDIFRAVFLEEDSLAEDIRELLREAGCATPGPVAIDVDFHDPGDETAPDRRYRLEFSNPERVVPAQPRPLPRASVTVVKGAAEEASYQLSKERVRIGRLAELLDRDGQMMRRNDIVFLDNGDEVNSTVGRAHATLLFDREKGEFRIIDEMSRYGTRIFREGRSIEVAGGNPRGVRLRNGDEIYVGQACIRFKTK
jgi:hypothetical protein